MLKNKSKNFCLSADDAGFLLPGLDTLQKLKELYPNFKFTIFTVPMPKQLLIKENIKHFSEKGYKKWAEILNSWDWLEVAIHGLFHIQGESTRDYKYTMEQIDACENVFNRHVGLTYVKIFKAPYWQYSWWALEALRDRGYTIALDRNHPLEVPEGCKTYYYNWSYEEKLPDKELVKGHGHMYKGKHLNDIETTFENISNQIPQDASFKFISEL